MFMRTERSMGFPISMVPNSMLARSRRWVPEMLPMRLHHVPFKSKEQIASPRKRWQVFRLFGSCMMFFPFFLFRLKQLLHLSGGCYTWWRMMEPHQGEWAKHCLTMTCDLLIKESTLCHELIWELGKYIVYSCLISNYPKMAQHIFFWIFHGVQPLFIIHGCCSWLNSGQARCLHTTHGWGYSSSLLLCIVYSYPQNR